MQTTRTPSTMRTASCTGDDTNQINEPDTAAAQTAPPGARQESEPSSRRAEAPCINARARDLKALIPAVRTGVIARCGCFVQPHSASPTNLTSAALSAPPSVVGKWPPCSQ